MLKKRVREVQPNKWNSKGKNLSRRRQKIYLLRLVLKSLAFRFEVSKISELSYQIKKHASDVVCQRPMYK